MITLFNLWKSSIYISVYDLPHTLYLEGYPPGQPETPVGFHVGTSFT